MMTQIYTDGACKGNPGPGGWGVVVIDNHDNILQQLSGSSHYTTNNKMELQAAISALEYIIQNIKHGNACIYTDSKYVYHGITEWIYGWKKREWNKVKNVELWQKLDELSRATTCNLSWQWVKAHAGNFGNEFADKLATEACAPI